MLHCRRAGLHAGAFWWGSQDQHALANRRGPVQGGPPGRQPYLPAVGRDRGRWRRGPEGVVHGAATASQVRPSVGGRGGGGWIRKAGHCRARGESKAKAFRPTPTIEGTSRPDPSPCRPTLDTRSQGYEGGSRAGAKGQGPRSDSRNDGLVKTVVPVPKRRC